MVKGRCLCGAVSFEVDGLHTDVLQSTNFAKRIRRRAPPQVIEIIDLPQIARGGGGLWACCRITTQRVNKATQ